MTLRFRKTKTYTVTCPSTKFRTRFEVLCFHTTTSFPPLPLGMPSSPFASAHIRQSPPHPPRHRCPLLPLPHHSPGPPPPLLTVTSPRGLSPIDAPPLIEGCGHPNSPQMPSPQQRRRRRRVFNHANTNDDAMSSAPPSVECHVSEKGRERGGGRK